jgi:hypothetical protein
LEEGAHLKFRTMFQARYREHDPPMAIGLHFLRRNTLKLMCPARMEPWFIDRIAVAAWQEASDDFGAPFDVDIYATYIGMAPKKIGQLRPSPTRPHYATITYFPGK